ncbi:MAG TPA: lysophospholipid acyltransferase family protein, partial [Pyrinomonadaceae bacterium]|nr:lysophospholipid acyltransferase family protein [Pyrinomonadaceae bacterium]
VDPALIMSAMPWRFQQHLAIAMDGERQYHYRHPLPGTPLILSLRGFFTYWLVIAFFNALPLPRRSGFRKSFEFAGEAMDRGNSILIFPEGELTKDGQLQKFKSGVGLLANGLEAPIVPVSITGLYELRHAGQRGWAPPGKVTITFGKPIPYDPDKRPVEITQQLEDQIRKLQTVSVARP